jgi:membrane protease YdiL (CAAX protease family)
VAATVTPTVVAVAMHTRRLECRSAGGVRRGDTPRTICAASLLTTAAVLGCATALGVISFDPKWPAAPWAFLAVNLLFTCVAEEAFFRGLIQERLATIRPESGAVAKAAVVASASLFAAAHLPGGTVQAALAGMAGLGCAVAYQRTRRIEAAVATHFTVNAVHFLGFTYPYIAS